VLVREIEYRVLGPVEVLLDGRPAPVFAPRQRAVLAALLLERNHVVSVGRLAKQLWGDSPPRQARNTIQSLVLRIRRTLAAAHRNPQGEVLLTQYQGYRLRVGPDQLDLDRFNSLASEGRRALSTDQPEIAARTLRRALTLWRGDPLADAAGVGLHQVDVPRLRERRLQAIEDRIEAEMQLGRHDELIVELPSLIAEHPMRERLHGQLMAALYNAGRQVEALDAFRVLRDTLVTDLGVEPGPALQLLHRRILGQDPSLL
jgi:DNA-binding SARP family transcriptional activator